MRKPTFLQRVLALPLGESIRIGRETKDDTGEMFYAVTRYALRDGIDDGRYGMPFLAVTAYTIRDMEKLVSSDTFWEPPKWCECGSLIFNLVSGYCRCGRYKKSPP